MYQSINQAFFGFDHALLSFWHGAAEVAGDVLTPLFRAVTFLGEKGILMFLIAGILMCRPRTRRLGLCMFGAVCCGALLTNVILKDMVARPRPFLASEEFAYWWKYVGCPAEDGFSFPSGHMTAAAAGVVAYLILSHRRWYAWLSGLWVLLMACARPYLMAHYPSDVLAAAGVGIVSALLACLIGTFLYRWICRHSPENGFCRFLIRFDVLHPTAWK